MNKDLGRLMISGVCLLLALSVMVGRPSGAAWGADILVGKLADVRGEVEVQRRGSANWVKATSGMAVNPGDQINTGIDGTASVVFKNSSTAVEPLTQFVIGRTFEDARAVTTELFLQAGKVISKVDPKSAKPNRFTVTTPTAVAGVRGTEQECSFNKGFGTQVKIRDGEGYMTPVRAEALPPAVQAMLNIAPAGGGRAGGVGEGSEKGRGEEKGKKEKKDESAATPAEAAAEFNAWIQQAEQALSGAGAAEGGDVAPLLDPQTLDYAIPISDGLSCAVQSASDPKGVIEPSAALQEAVAPSILPAGSTPQEDKAALTSTEIVDAPVTITVVEAQAQVKEAVQVQSTISTTTTVTPPNRPE